MIVERTSKIDDCLSSNRIVRLVAEKTSLCLSSPAAAYSTGRGVRSSFPVFFFFSPSCAKVYFRFGRRIRDDINATVTPNTKRSNGADLVGSDFVARTHSGRAATPVCYYTVRWKFIAQRSREAHEKHYRHNGFWFA